MRLVLAGILLFAVSLSSTALASADNSNKDVAISHGLFSIAASANQNDKDDYFTNGFDLVPLTNDAYESFRQLKLHNLLIGYPSNYFDGTHELYRFDFEIALCQAILTYEQQLHADAEMVSTIDQLRAKFPDVEKLVVQTKSFYSDGAEDFVDLPSDDWAYSALKALAEAGVLTSFPAKYLNSDRLLTKLDISLLVYQYFSGTDYRQAQVDPVALALVHALQARFTEKDTTPDVEEASIPSGLLVYGAISELEKRGIMTGFPPDYFDGSTPRSKKDFERAVYTLLNHEDGRDDPVVQCMLQGLYSHFEAKHIDNGSSLMISYQLANYDHPNVTAYDDVPTDHWAYEALECLVECGCLDRYPQGFFSGERVLTRYDFAQAVRRLELQLTDKMTVANSLETALTLALFSAFSDLTTSQQ